MCKMTKPLHGNEQNEYSLYKAGHDFKSGVNKRQVAYVKILSVNVNTVHQKTLPIQPAA